MLAACVPVALGLGGEFIPKLDEGDLVIDLTRPPERLARARRSPTRPGSRRPCCEAFPDEIRSVVSQIRPARDRPRPGRRSTPTDVYVFLTEPERLDQGPRPRTS